MGAGRPLEKGRGAVWRVGCQKLRVERPEGSLCLPSPPPAVLLPEDVLRVASESQPGGTRLILFDQNFSSFFSREAWKLEGDLCELAHILQLKETTHTAVSS